MDILTRIIEKRRTDIESLGLDFGLSLPEARKRPLHPFLKTKGVILEVKRASPSKGDISPELDAYQTALSYARAGAAAISCLTEGNFFKGSLYDLVNVCRAIDDYASDDYDSSGTVPAVLRKDFLLFPEEVEISYKAGADAVLLIARILPKETLLKMAEEVVRLGMSALIEIRSDEDLEKLSYIFGHKDFKALTASNGFDNFVCGVNSRDLATFKIDLLRPCMMFQKIRAIMGENSRIVFESGVTNYECAAAVSSMGFTGLLLGEAAAKNPELRKGLVDSFVSAKATRNAEFWKKYAESYYVELVSAPQQIQKQAFFKICGLTRIEDALEAEKLGAKFLGFIFADAFPRSITRDNRLEKLLPKLVKLQAKKIAVIVDLDSPESKIAVQLVKDGVFDALQFHKIQYEKVDKSLLELPHYFVAGNLDDYEALVSKGEMRVLLDSKEIVLGKAVSSTKIDTSNIVDSVNKSTKLSSKSDIKTTYEIKWIAGGITPENVSDVINHFSPELIDVSGGVETDDSIGIKDVNKMRQLASYINYQCNNDNRSTK